MGVAEKVPPTSKTCFLYIISPDLDASKSFCINIELVKLFQMRYSMSSQDKGFSYYPGSKITQSRQINPNYHGNNVFLEPKLTFL